MDLGAIGSAELTRLWRESGDQWGAKPAVADFLAPLREQLDPAEQIDAEYRVSADPVHTRFASYGCSCA